MTLRPGTRVRTSSADPDHHTRLPRYLRGQVGEIVYAGREWPLPDDVARGVAAPRAETVYTVRFAAAGLWGTGRHTVLADLWESYLEQADGDGEGDGDGDGDGERRRPTGGTVTAEPDHHDLPVAARVRRLEERVIAAGLASDGELDEALARFYARATPVNGARLVARAWTDPRFRARLLADGSAAAAELGFGPQVSSYQLRVVANSPQRHNVIVCTLCSCYPVALLGPSPSWYKSLAYRSRTVREPRAVLSEFGLVVPKEVDIAVWDSTAETRYLVLPVRPDGTDSLAEDELAALATRDGLIGTARV